MSNLDQSVLKALKLLEFLATTEDGLRITELSEKSGYPVSTTHRLLATLSAMGYVEQDPHTNRYHLGIKVLSLQAQAIRQRPLMRLAITYLNRLKQEVNETVNLGILSEKSIVYLESLVPDSSLAFYSPPGTKMPLHCTATGKVLLAYMPALERERLLASLPLPPATPNTITSMMVLRNHLEEIQVRGYAIDDEEYAVGVRCIAAPIVDHRNQVIAGVSVTAPANRLTPDREEIVSSLVVGACEAISRELGYPGSEGTRQRSDRQTR
ncbi:MAG: IclR family transcriptional regulator [Ardenticatenaceae bacterium]|nr:IclR family transcriptional regulator [Ardenticatenaceae bacterium]